MPQMFPSFFSILFVFFFFSFICLYCKLYWTFFYVMSSKSLIFSKKKLLIKW